MAARGKALAALSGGAASVARPAAEVASLLASRAEPLEIAVVNGPSATVVSGAEEALAALGAGAARRGSARARVAIGYAAHSAACRAGP